MTELMCASGGKCEGICKETNLNRKRVGLKDGKKTDKKGKPIYISEPYNVCPSAYENKPKRVYRKCDED